MKTLKVFENINLGKVEVLNLNNDILFNANDTARVLGINNIRMSIDTKDEDYIIKVTNDMVNNNSIASNTHNRKLHNTGESFLTEAGLYKIVFSSRKDIAKTFQKWLIKDIIPSIRKSDNYSIVDKTIGAKELIECASLISDKFNISGIETVKRLEQVLKDEGYNQVANLLPSYDNTIKEVSNRVTHPYSYFYKSDKYPTININLIQFNKLAFDKGLYSKKDRIQPNGIIKAWYVIDNFTFGENIISKQNDLETQIHLYDDTIEEFYNMVVGVK